MMPLKFLIANTFGRLKFMRDKIIPEIFYRSYSKGIFEDAFEKYKPDLVFAPHLFGQFDQALVAEANKRKIVVSKEEVDLAMNQIAETNGGEGEISKALEELYGLSVGEFRKLVSNQLLRDKINKELISRVSVRHILVRVVEDATDAQVEETKQKITGYRNEIINGLDFSEAAKKYSEDVGSNEDGGKLEAFSRSEMVAEFEDVAFSAKTGEISEPFKTSFGWHFMEVLEKRGEIDMSFEDFLAQLRARAVTVQLYRP